MLRVTPVYGCEEDTKVKSNVHSPPPLCTLVEYGGVNVIVNMGWNEFYLGKEDVIKKAVLSIPHIDVIVLTDSSLSSLGGLCVVYSKEGKIPPIVATYPTMKMGQMTLYDTHANYCQDGKFKSFTLEAMDAVFSSVQTLKYAQSFICPKSPVKITPHRAGHVVGASYYIMETTSDETQVVLAPTYHHAKERHLDNTTLFQYATACDVFVTTQPPTSMIPSPKNRPAVQLVETVLATLRRGGHALIPVDASGRVMELLLLLDQYWASHFLRNLYPIIWVGPMVIPTSDLVSCQLEWMAKFVGEQFDSQRGNPFSLNQIYKCTSYAECEAILQKGEPTCILASGASLDHGPARDIFHKIISDDPNHCLLFTNAHQSCVPRSTIGGEEKKSTAGQCLEAWWNAKERNEELPDVLTVTGLEVEKLPLQGKQLQEFTQMEYQRQLQRQQEEQRQAMLQQVELAKQKLLSNILPEETTSSSSVATSSKQSQQKTAASKRFDPDLFLKFSKPCHMMFEVREEALGVGQSDSVAKYGIGESIGKRGEVVQDDYGIAVQPDRFMDIVSGVTHSNNNNANQPYGYANTNTNSSANNANSANANTEGDNSNTKTNASEMDILDGEAADLSEGRGIIRGRNGQPPIQVSTKEVSIDILAEIVYIPMEGKVDAMAAKNSIRALQPRQVVYMNKISEEEPSQNVHYPIENGKAMELKVGHAAYPVRLLDTPLLTSEDEESPSTLEPYEAKMGDCTVRLLDCVATGKIVKEDKAIVLAPSTSNKKRKKPSYLVSDGTVLLTDLRSEFIARGMKADYTVHPDVTQILVNGRILVQKQNSNENESNDDTIHVEGPLCQDFYTVRQIVSSQYITLS